jgi:hypothetical protein
MNHSLLLPPPPLTLKIVQEEAAMVLRWRRCSAAAQVLMTAGSRDTFTRPCCLLRFIRRRLR